MLSCATIGVIFRIRVMIEEEPKLGRYLNDDSKSEKMQQIGTAKRSEITGLPTVVLTRFRHKKRALGYCQYVLQPVEESNANDDILLKENMMKD